MANHFHLQMETREKKLSTIMERLLKAYAITFNRNTGSAYRELKQACEYAEILQADPIEIINKIKNS